MNIFRFSRAFFGLAVVALSLLLSSCEKPQDAFAVEREFAGALVFRGGIKNVRKFKDDTYMHGLSYYYFQAEPPEISRLITWLNLQKGDRMPEQLSNLATSAAARNGWKFAWATAQVYLAHYCTPLNADGTYSRTEVLLVSNGEGLYVTRGYLPDGATRIADSSGCSMHGYPR